MTERMRFLRGTAAVASILVLAACSTRVPSPPPEPSRPAPAPAPLSPIHQDLDPLEMVWHVRAGLNVAALSCAQRVGPGIVTDYNAFSAYVVIFFAQGQAAVIELDAPVFGCGSEFTANCIPRFGNPKGKDQSGRTWEICAGSFCV